MKCTFFSTEFTKHFFNLCGLIFKVKQLKLQTVNYLIWYDKWGKQQTYTHSVDLCRDKR